MYAYPNPSGVFINYLFNSLEDVLKGDLSLGEKYPTKGKVVDGVGCAIVVTVKEDGSISYKKNQFPAARWPNKEEVAEWIVKKRAVDASKVVLKEAKADLLKEQLEPIRQAYLSSNYSTRTAILAEVMRIITSGRL